MSAEPDSPAPGELYCPTCEKTYGYGDRCPDDGTRLVRLSTGAESLIGRELDGRYTIVQQIGEGGMGTVYRANQHSVGREVAIKVVLPKLVSESATVKRFLREAKLASRLAHPNAVSVLDFGQTSDGLFYLVMELVNGRTLDAVLAKDASLPQDRVVRIATQICDALEGAHQLQIVHRDLKPANVMLLSTGRDLVKVLDFGLAKSLLPDIDAATVTSANALVGTPAFMPPELVTGGRRDADERADLYSLGCVLYTAIMGEQPFVASTVHELIAMHASEPPPPMVGVPGGLAIVIGKLLEKDPERRYRTATKAREALEISLGGAPSQPADPTLVTPPVSQTALGWGSALAQPSRTVRAVRRAPLPAQLELAAPTRLVRAPDAPNPKPAPAPTRRTWPWVVLLVVAIALVAVLSLTL